MAGRRNVVSMQAPHPSLILCLALCLALSAVFAPTANALIVEEIMTIQRIIENLLLGVVGDLQRVRNLLDMGSDYVKNLIRSESNELQRSINEARKDYEKEYRRQLKEASKASGREPGNLEKAFEKQVEKAEDRFRRQQREAEKQAEAAERTAARAERAAREFRSGTHEQYDADKLQREIQAQMREYERELNRLRKQQEQALREFHKNRRSN
jgi:hypothetical protein